MSVDWLRNFCMAVSILTTLCLTSVNSFSIFCIYWSVTTICIPSQTRLVARLINLL